MVKYSTSFLVPRNFFRKENCIEKMAIQNASYMHLLLCPEHPNYNTEIKQATSETIQLFIPYERHVFTCLNKNSYVQKLTGVTKQAWTKISITNIIRNEIYYHYFKN